jgi:2-hydroxychromene-2-carboxylate isomerase
MSEQKPEGFPHLTLGVQRALVAVSQKAPEKLAPATEAIWKEYWVKGDGKATQREGFIPILEGVLGEAETKAVVEAVRDHISYYMMQKPIIYVQASGAEVKARLSANTQQAFDSGAFGLPWFECTNSKGETEGFWGIDHLGQVADFLGLDRSVEGGFRAYL